MSNDPYSWCNVDRLDRMIRKDKEEFKKEELKAELKDEEINDDNRRKT